MSASVVDTIVVRILSDYTNYQNGMRSVVNIAQSTTQTLTQLGVRLSAAVTAPLALLGRRGVSEFAKLEDTFVRAYALFGNVSDEQKRRIEEGSAEMANRSINSVLDIAESYRTLAAAGYRVQQSMESMEVFNKYATAGVMDLTYATEMLVKAQTALGLASDNPQHNLEGLVRTANALTAAGAISLADPEKIVRSINTKYGAALRQVNKPVEEGAAVLAAMAQRGTVGELAGEQGYIMLRDLQAAALDNAEAFKMLGVEVYNSNGEMHHTADILAGLERLFIGVTDEQKKAALATLGFTDRSVAATMMLIGASGEIREYERRIRDAKTAIDDLAQANMQSFYASWQQIFNQMQNVRVEIGRALVPTLTALGGYIKSGIALWNGWSNEVKRSVVELGAYAAIGGPVLYFTGMLLGNIRGLIMTTIGLTSAYGVLTGTLGDIVGEFASWLNITDATTISIMEMIAAGYGILTIVRMTGAATIAIWGFNAAIGVITASLSALVYIFGQIGLAVAAGPVGIAILLVRLGIAIDAISAGASVVSDNMGRIRNELAAMAEDALRAFGGIKDAVVGGDFKLAVQIMTAFIETEFERLIETLSRMWEQFVVRMKEDFNAFAGFDIFDARSEQHKKLDAARNKYNAPEWQQDVNRMLGFDVFDPTPGYTTHNERMAVEAADAKNNRIREALGLAPTYRPGFGPGEFNPYTSNPSGFMLNGANPYLYFPNGASYTMPKPNQPEPQTAVEAAKARLDALVAQANSKYGQTEKSLFGSIGSYLKDASIDVGKSVLGGVSKVAGGILDEAAAKQNPILQGALQSKLDLLNIKDKGPADAVAPYLKGTAEAGQAIVDATRAIAEMKADQLERQAQIDAAEATAKNTELAVEEARQQVILLRDVKQKLQEFLTGSGI
jgi:TP901 family phage tail tape measure protein